MKPFIIFFLCAGALGGIAYFSEHRETEQERELREAMFAVQMDTCMRRRNLFRREPAEFGTDIYWADRDACLREISQ